MVPTEDGECLVEALVGPHHISASASERDVLFGAASVIKGCIETQQPSRGGLAKELGQFTPYT